MSRVQEHEPVDSEVFSAVEAVHRAFYAAWEADEVDAALALWLDAEDISIAFPGAGPSWGRDAVVATLTEGMELTRGIQFVFEDLRVASRGGVARLTCVEHVMVPGKNLEEMLELPASTISVHSTLVLTPQGWRIWSHTSGPVLIGMERE